MAKEFIVLESTPGHKGTENYRILAFYPVSPPITINTIVVKPTPSELLPSIVDEHNMMTPAQKGALDSGAYVFEERIIIRKKGMTGAQMVELLKVIWTKRNTRVVLHLRRKYQISGMWVNV